MIGNMTSQQQLYTKAEYLSALNAAMKEIDPDASVVEGDVLSCIFSAVAEVLSASSDRKSTRLNSSHAKTSRMPSSA